MYNQLYFKKKEKKKEGGRKEKRHIRKGEASRDVKGVNFSEQGT